MRKNHTAILLFHISFLFAASSWSMDKVVLRNYDILEGEVVRVSDLAVRFQNPESMEVREIPRSEVARILYEDGEVMDLTSGVSQSQSAKKTAQTSDVITRHDYFFFRALWGYGSSMVETAKSPVESAGAFSNISGLQLGGSIVSGHALFVEFTSNGTYLPTEPESIMAYGGFGIGYSLYLMPSNIHFDVALSRTVWVIEYDEKDIYGNTIKFSTGLGTGIMLSVGKEWFVSKNWGFGLAAYAQFGSLPGNGYTLEETVQTGYYDAGSVEWQSFGLVATATYN